MKFGIFYEHQLPRPWAEDSEHKLFKDALDQIELADELGYDYVWEVEHHFLEEYSHSSAPEVFLAAASQRIVAHPPRPRHRAPAAEVQPHGIAPPSASPPSTWFRTAGSTSAPARPRRRPSSRASASSAPRSVSSGTRHSTP